MQDFEIRPWGEWHVLDAGDGFKVKRIEVNPGETVLATAGQSIYVEVGQPHRITNMHDEILVIIEVQLGEYTGEDDICRLEDDYGRAPAAV